jgi:hypothetical protein
MYSQKYIFQIALKCETERKRGKKILNKKIIFFLNIKKKIKKSGRARFSGTGGDDHQFFFFIKV